MRRERQSDFHGCGAGGLGTGDRGGAVIAHAWASDISFGVQLKRSVMMRCNSPSGSLRNSGRIAAQRCLHSRAVVGHDVPTSCSGEIRAVTLAVDFRKQVVKGAALSAGNIVERLPRYPVQADCGSPNAAFLYGFHAQSLWNVLTYPK
jgi:hypothetical protein